MFECHIYRRLLILIEMSNKKYEQWLVIRQKFLVLLPHYIDIIYCNSFIKFHTTIYDFKNLKVAFRVN